LTSIVSKVSLSLARNKTTKIFIIFMWVQTISVGKTKQKHFGLLKRIWLLERVITE
jgi:hypothetical protein